MEEGGCWRREGYWGFWVVFVLVMVGGMKKDSQLETLMLYYVCRR